MKLKMIDKSTWPKGEWIDEPDFLVFVYEKIPCVINRNHHIGTLNGYIGIPIDDPQAKLSYDAFSNLVEVHYGFTYKGYSLPYIQGELPDHINEEDYTWFGFDTAHLGDIWPNGPKFTADKDETYKNMDFMIKELKRAVEQFLKLENNNKDAH